ncbi:glycosyltransferase family 2 protein [Candidatus Saccharibacteria bacterium]|nr:MAG: glycosyltransferase family 2 protein [Candidatus Saccharibacteria bacterium]
MYVWLGLWAVVAALEALLYAFGSKILQRTLSGRLAVSLVLGTALVVVDVGLLLNAWKYWLLAVFITPYRLVNLARFVKHRLHVERLRAVSLRAHGWQITAQLVLLGLCLALHTVPLTTLVALVASAQLLGVLTLLRASMQTWEHAKPVPLAKHYSNSQLPSVSVLIPARDETEALRVCLDSLVANDYPRLEILVLDDCSVSKKTPEIIRSYAQSGVRFIKGELPPEDWIAKNYGYEQLRRDASGDVLLYCGVDTVFEPRAIRAIVETMLSREKEMMSVLPTRAATEDKTVSFLQTMRYYWELCLPRRMFKRPPVLSTCWIVRKDLLQEFGGLGAVSQSVSPEAHFAKLAVAKDIYTFVRSHGDLQIHSTKTLGEQFNTTVRLRYPQLHRRLELVAATTLFELFFFIGPFVGLPVSFLLPHTGAYFAIWFGAVLAVELMYYLIAVQTKLNSAWVAFVTAPFGFAADVVMLHISMLRYEFGTVNWKGRNVCIPVMRVEPRLPKVS